jgi:hypothetical protein
MKERKKLVREALGISPGKNIEWWNLRGHAADIEHVVNRTLTRFRGRQFDLIILDPIYKCLGWRDENKAGDVTDLLNHIERLSEGTGAAVVIAAHYAKGDAHEKSAKDRVSGSGVFMRDPDAAINLTACAGEESNDPKRFEVDVTLREFAPVDQFKVKWEFPLLRRFTAEEVKEEKEAKEDNDAKFLIELARLLDDEGTTVKAWFERAQVKLGYKSALKSFYRMANKVETAGLVKIDKGENNANIYKPDAEAISKAEGAIDNTFTIDGETPF